VAAAMIATVALGRGGLPSEAGRPPEAAVGRPVWPVVLGIAIALPLLALFVHRSAIAGVILAILGGGALIWLLFEAIQSERVERERLFVVLILMFFSMLFWAFFEQAGSSINNFTDRNVDRVIEQRNVRPEEVGQRTLLRVPLETEQPDLQLLPVLTQEQLGHANGVGAPFTITDLDRARATAAAAPPESQVMAWTVAESSIGMGIGGAEIPASTFQAANPVFILLFGLIFTALWSLLAARRLEPSTPVKFALGLLQLGLGFGALWVGAETADPRGMVSIAWLLLGYLLHTTGELCLSPVGLSMVTRLSPGRIVSTVMGGWFMATAFSQYLAGWIAQLTGVGAAAGAAQVVPPPSGTVHLYGDVFGQIAISAIVSAVVCFALSPLLARWMHSEVDAN